MSAAVPILLISLYSRFNDAAIMLPHPCVGLLWKCCHYAPSSI